MTGHIPKEGKRLILLSIVGPPLGILFGACGGLALTQVFPKMFEQAGYICPQVLTKVASSTSLTLLIHIGFYFSSGVLLLLMIGAAYRSEWPSERAMSFIAFLVLGIVCLPAGYFAAGVLSLLVGAGIGLVSVIFDLPITTEPVVKKIFLGLLGLVLLVALASPLFPLVRRRPAGSQMIGVDRGYALLSCVVALVSEGVLLHLLPMYWNSPFHFGRAGVGIGRVVIIVLVLTILTVALLLSMPFLSDLANSTEVRLERVKGGYRFTEESSPFAWVGCAVVVLLISGALGLILHLGWERSAALNVLMDRVLTVLLLSAAVVLVPCLLCWFGWRAIHREGGKV